MSRYNARNYCSSSFARWTQPVNKTSKFCWNRLIYSNRTVGCSCKLQVVLKFAKKGLIHASSFSTLRLCNSAFVWLTALKLGSRTFLSLHVQDRTFQLNSLLINKVMLLQSCTSHACIRPFFANPVTITYKNRLIYRLRQQYLNAIMEHNRTKWNIIEA